jgi:2',3'-cyclic-nucleotide 2'-phosphodiesterase (5'-nucleotidase family)
MPPHSLTLLHTNDIHGRVEDLARITTLVEQTRGEEESAPVLYFDAGDAEEPTSRLSNLTRGSAMHRLLSVAGCDAAVAGNGAWVRYGPQVLRDYAAQARYPLLLANLRTLERNRLRSYTPARCDSA